MRDYQKRANATVDGTKSRVRYRFIKTRNGEKTDRGRKAGIELQAAERCCRESRIEAEEVEKRYNMAMEDPKRQKRG